MIDRRHIGYETPPFTAEVEKGRLRLFAKAIGETDPKYFDEAAARAAGYASLPVPPTFLFCLEMEQPDPYAWFDDVGIELPKVLHGEQSFTYHRTPCAGETLTFRSKIVDIYDKKGGLLEFVVQDNTITDEKGAPVAEFRRSIVIRHG